MSLEVTRQEVQSHVLRRRRWISVLLLVLPLQESQDEVEISHFALFWCQNVKTYVRLPFLAQILFQTVLILRLLSAKIREMWELDTAPRKILKAAKEQGLLSKSLKSKAFTSHLSKEKIKMKMANVEGTD